MKLRVLIVDDEELSLLRLKDLLHRIPDVEICAEASNGSDAVRLANRLKPDLLILDIEMPGMDGFRVLEKLKDPPLFLFATAYDRYAVKAFEVQSLDYLLKPFTMERLTQAVARAREQLSAGARPTLDIEQLLDRLKERSAKGPTRFTSRKKGKVVVLAAEELTHFMAEDTMLFACIGPQRFAIQGTIAALEQSLDPDRYFRCHRSFIVNLDMIKELRPLWKGKYVIELRDPQSTAIPLSRRQAKLLRERFPW